MVVVEGRQLSLPSPSVSSHPHYSPPPHITSLLFEPASKSLALHHSDSSFSVYPSLTPLSISSLPAPLVFVPAPTSSATFFHLRYNQPNRDPDSFFLCSSPFLGGTAVLLRFYIFNPARKTFVRPKVVCNHRDLRFDENKFGVVFGISHGVSVKLVGGINVFALYSASNSKIWVFAVRMVDEFRVVKLMKCAVIDCSLPVFSMNVFFDYLILGEENGVRVFQLRPLLKGRVKKERRVNGRRNLSGGMEKDASKLDAKKVNYLQNGFVQGINSIGVGSYSSSYSGKNVPVEEEMNVPSEGQWEGKNEKHADSVKLRTLKLRQDSREGVSCFMAFCIKEVESYKSTKMPVKSTKAMSIHSVSPNRFLILDSDGVLHLLHLHNSIHGPDFSYNMERLTQTMKVRKLAVLPGAQTIWISDGHQTVHVLVVADAEISTNESDRKNNEKLLTKTSVTQAIFLSEKIQEIMPLGVDAMLVLGQGSMLIVLQNYMVDHCQLTSLGTLSNGLKVQLYSITDGIDHCQDVEFYELLFYRNIFEDPAMWLLGSQDS